ncbi:hypothetical protein B5X24_HaOG214692 [Helicoverpa armigera]|nr:hypothetical protein B5X24_HaOG214692 [Helicoverpa armigera]
MVDEIGLLGRYIREMEHSQQLFAGKRYTCLQCEAGFSAYAYTKNKFRVRPHLANVPRMCSSRAVCELRACSHCNSLVRLFSATHARLV